LKASRTSFFLVGVYCDGGGGPWWNDFWIPLPGIDADVSFIAWQKSKASKLSVSYTLHFLLQLFWLQKIPSTGYEPGYSSNHDTGFIKR